MNSGAWSYVTVTLSGNPTQDGQTTIYINGLPSNSGADTSSGVSGDDSAQTAFLANDSIGVNGEPAPFNGATDEFRISNVARSADWIATEYTNQSSPATFYALYPENTVQVLPATVTLYAFQSQQFAVPGSGVCSSAAVTWAISLSEPWHDRCIRGVHSANQHYQPADGNCGSEHSSERSNNRFGDSDPDATSVDWCDSSKCDGLLPAI